MTVKKAIEILERYYQLLQNMSQGWYVKADSFTVSDIKETSIMLGDNAKNETKIIKRVLDELKPKKKNVSK